MSAGSGTIDRPHAMSDEQLHITAQVNARALAGAQYGTWHHDVRELALGVLRLQEQLDRYRKRSDS